MPPRFRAAAVPALLAVAVAACGDGAGPSGAAPVAPTLRAASDTMREGIAGEALPAPLTVRVSRGGAPAAGEAVTFRVIAGGGTVAPAIARTDASGVAAATWTLGGVVGEQRVEVALASGGVVSFRGTARSAVPTLERTVFATGFTNPWDLAWLPDGSVLVSERSGAIVRRTASGQQAVLVRPADVVVSGEGGMLGLAVEADVATARFLYACFSSRAGGVNDNRVVRWRLADDFASVSDRVELVTGLPWANGGRHSGCRPRIGPDGHLWIGTGDAAIGTTPQDLRSLGGKVLRVTRDGRPAPGNPVLAGDPRVYSFGHRNVQGLAFQPGTDQPFSAEHGPGRDDEVNRLQPGMNAGWDPIPGYNESVPMTDLGRFPAAVPAIWSTGAPARGTSGATFLRGRWWRAWNGALVLGQLSGQRLVVLTFDAAGRVASTTTLFDGLGVRLRTPVLGPDSALYVTTDAGGGQGQVWRLTPR